MADALFQTTGQIRLQVVQPLLPVLELPAWMGANKPPCVMSKKEFFIGKLTTQQLPHPFIALLQKFTTRKNALGNNLCRSAGRGRAEIGGKVSNREIRFMANGRNDRKSGFKNGSRNNLFIERPQIFERTAAAGD